MMNRKVRMRRGFWSSVAILLAWMGLLQGAHSIVRGTIELFAVLNLVLGALAIVLVLIPSIIEKLISLEVEVWRLALSMVVILFFASTVAISGTPTITLSSADKAFYTIQQVGTIVIMAIVIWQMIRSVRNSAVDPR